MKKIRIFNSKGKLIKKECGVCKEVKLVEDFYPGGGKTCIDGFMHLCITCAKLRWHKRAEDPEARKRWLLQRIKSKCNKDEIPFNITVEDIVVPEICPILGIPLKFGVKGNKLYERKGEKRVPYDSPSIDRIIPDKGYVKGNIVVVSYRANFLKCDATPEELQRLSDFYNALKTL